MNDTQLRMDIQVLRALAVLAVVIYHTGLEVLPGGYLGVDIFFVISGFLIGKMIMTSCDSGTFSFADFYLRRLFRLVPATLCTLFFTTVLASVLLTHAGWEDFQSQLLGALTFTANFALYFQLDYFAPAAERMPLLHMWSLAIEEQFYLFAPVVIFLTPARLRTAVFLVFGGLSALACFTLMFGWIDLPVSTKRAQSTAFYMLPTRAWQLILGCLGAWVMLQRPRLTIPAFAKWGALAGTIYLLIAPVGISHPAEDAFLVCCFTLLLLLGQDNWVPRMAITAVFRKIGDWSYSIYLVHWPLFAFANNLFIAGPPLWSICLLCVASIGLGAAQFYYVETPFRYGWTAHKARALAGLCAAAIAMSLVALPSLTNALYPQDMRISEIPPNVGLSTVCNQKGAVFEDLPECRTVNAPRVALLGDSLAMQWGEALAEHSEAIGGLMQITKSACAPVLGVAQIHGRYTKTWATECIDFMDDSLAFIANSDTVETIVVSSGYVQVMAEEGQSILNEGVVQPANATLGVNAARAALQRLVDAGKTVVLLGTPAMTGIDYGLCQQRRLSGLLSVGTPNCTFRLAAFEEEQPTLVNALEEFGRIEGVTLVWPHDAYCEDGLCQTYQDGEVYYRDVVHLTVEATRMIAADLKLIERLTPN